MSEEEVLPEQIILKPKDNFELLYRQVVISELEKDLRLLEWEKESIMARHKEALTSLGRRMVDTQKRKQAAKDKYDEVLKGIAGKYNIDLQNAVFDSETGIVSTAEG